MISTGTLFLYLTRSISATTTESPIFFLCQSWNGLELLSLIDLCVIISFIFSPYRANLFFSSSEEISDKHFILDSQYWIVSTGLSGSNRIKLTGMFVPCMIWPATCTAILSSSVVLTPSLLPEATVSTLGTKHSSPYTSSHKWPLVQKKSSLFVPLARYSYIPFPV